MYICTYIHRTYTYMHHTYTYIAKVCSHSRCPQNYDVMTLYVI